MAITIPMVPEASNKGIGEKKNLPSVLSVWCTVGHSGPLYTWPNWIVSFSLFSFLLTPSPLVTPLPILTLGSASSPLSSPRAARLPWRSKVICAAQFAMGIQSDLLLSLHGSIVIDCP